VVLTGDNVNPLTVGENREVVGVEQQIHTALLVSVVFNAFPVGLLARGGRVLVASQEFGLQRLRAVSRGNPEVRAGTEVATVHDIGVGSAPFSAKAAWNLPFNQSWM